MAWDGMARTASACCYLHRTSRCFAMVQSRRKKAPAQQGWRGMKRMILSAPIDILPAAIGHHFRLHEPKPVVRGVTRTCRATKSGHPRQQTARTVGRYHRHPAGVSTAGMGWDGMARTVHVDRFLCCCGGGRRRMTGGETRSIHTSDIQKTPFRVSRRVARCRREAFDETAARRAWEAVSEGEGPRVQRIFELTPAGFESLPLRQFSPSFLGAIDYAFRSKNRMGQQKNPSVAEMK